MYTFYSKIFFKSLSITFLVFVLSHNFCVSSSPYKLYSETVIGSLQILKHLLHAFIS